MLPFPQTSRYQKMAARARHRANRQWARAHIYQSLSGCFTTSPPDTKSDIITLMPWMSLAAALSSPPPTHMAGACWMISARTVPTILGQSPCLFMFWLRAGRLLAGGIGLFAPDPLRTVMIQLSCGRPGHKLFTIHSFGWQSFSGLWYIQIMNT